MTSTAASSSTSSRHSASSSNPNRSNTTRNNNTFINNNNSPADAALQSLHEPHTTIISTSSSNANAALLGSLPEMSSIFNTADAAQTAHRLSSNSDKFQITPYKNTNSSVDWLSAQTREILGPSNNIFSSSSSGFSHPKKSPIYSGHDNQIMVDSSQISSNESLLNARNPPSSSRSSLQSHRHTPNNNLNASISSSSSSIRSSSTKPASSSSSASRQSLPSGSNGSGGRLQSNQPFTSKSITPPLTISSNNDAASRINANRPSSTTFYPPYSSSSSSSLSQSGGFGKANSSLSPVKQAFNLNKSNASANSKLAQRRPIDTSGLDLDEIFKVILGFNENEFFFFLLELRNFYFFLFVKK